MPPGVVSTIRPSPPLTVSTFPFGATMRPSGTFSLPPELTTMPVPALLCRITAFGIALIRLARLFATYSVPLRLSPTPGRADHQRRGVGALREARADLGDALHRGRLAAVPGQGQPEHGAPVHDLAVGRDGAVEHVGHEQLGDMWPKLTEVMSHGPLMPLPEMVSRT